MPDDIQQLIARYRDSMRVAARIRMLSAAVIFVIVSGFVLWLYDRFEAFQREKAPEIVAALHDEFTHPDISSQKADMVADLTPAYMAAVSEAFDTHRPALISATETELESLQAHARKRFPEIQDAIETMVRDQETAARAALVGVLDEDTMQAVIQQYAAAIQLKLSERLGSDLSAHQAQALEIGANLERLSRERSERAPATLDSRELMGIMFELSGRNIRQSL